MILRAGTERRLEDVFFLLAGHGHRIFMRIAVRPDLMSGRGDHFRLFGKSLDRVARDEPTCLDFEFIEQLEQPWRANLAGKNAALNVGRRILAAV